MKIPVPPPSLSELLALMGGANQDGSGSLGLLAHAGAGPAPGGKYRHWDTFRHLAPPDGWTTEQWWSAVKLARRSLYQRLPLKDTAGRHFVYALPNPALEMIHRVDRDASGAIRGEGEFSKVVGPGTRDTYLFTSLVEEAITSSQLEGASTTRRVAKAMIQEGRAPRDRGERMIHNNYQALLFVRRTLDQPLTPEVVFELHRIITEGTLDDAGAAGRFRRPEDEIVVSDELGQVLFTPPPAGQLSQRLRALCDFANAKGSGEFIPPSARAILLHFWLAYDHPFVDGNGRTARALFYWSMARQGYWLCEFVSISRVLKRARSAYTRSFLYTETDDNDVTYFMLHQLRVLLLAIDELHTYLARKGGELRQAEKLIRSSRLRIEFNARQLALVNHALRRPDAVYTVESHRVSHGVVYQTARTDLLALVRKGVLEQRKRGRTFVFLVPDDLHARLEGGRGRGKRLEPRVD